VIFFFVFFLNLPFGVGDPLLHVRAQLIQIVIMTVSLTYRHLPDSDTRFLDLVKNLSFFIGIVVKRKVFENVVSAYVV